MRKCKLNTIIDLIVIYQHHSRIDPGTVTVIVEEFYSSGFLRISNIYKSEQLYAILTNE